MVTRNVIDGPFPPGAPVRLLVGVLAWPAPDLGVPATSRRMGRRVGTAMPPTYLTAADDLRFVAAREDKAGGCVVADAHGERWFVPTDYIEALA